LSTHKATILSVLSNAKLVYSHPCSASPVHLNSFCETERAHLAGPSSFHPTFSNYVNLNQISICALQASGSLYRSEWSLGIWKHGVQTRGAPGKTFGIDHSLLHTCVVYNGALLDLSVPSNHSGSPFSHLPHQRPATAFASPLLKGLGPVVFAQITGTMRRSNCIDSHIALPNPCIVDCQKIQRCLGHRIWNRSTGRRFVLAIQQ